MKKAITYVLAAVIFLLTSHLFAQDDVKSGEEQKSKNKKTESTVKDAKTDKKQQMGGYTKSGKIVMPPTTIQQPSNQKTGSVKSDIPDAGNIYDRMGKLKATVGPDGKLYDVNGELLGQFNKNREYLGPDGTLLGTVRNGVITGKKGKEIGKIGKDGKVVNAKGKLLGTIYNDGTIRNSRGSRLGYAPGVDRDISAIVFFYHKKSSSRKKKQNKKSKPSFDVKPIGKQ